MVELSANSVVGMSSPRTLKLRGQIRDEEVVVLVDSGASHNFISEALMRKLKLEAKDTVRYGVLVAGGVRVKGRGVVEGVTLQNCAVETSYLPLELGIADVILGVQWLDTLGETRFNWKLQWMKFLLDEATVTLHGDPSLHTAEVSLKILWKTLDQEGEGMLVEYAGLTTEVMRGAESYPEACTE